MINKISKEQSNILNCARAFAVFSVICAHVKPIESASFGMIISYSVLEIIGYGGVSLFFFLSGFFFAFNKDPFSAFCRKKSVNLILPWLITGTLVYLYSNLRKETFSIFGLLKNLAGSGSYLWYMSVLLILYLIFFFLGKYRVFLIIAPIISVASFFINDIIYPYLYTWGGDYLNFFNWMLFFWSGFMIAKAGYMEKIIRHLARVPYIYILLYFLCVGVLVYTRVDMNYRTPLYIIYSLVFFFACMSGAIIVRKIKLFNLIGGDSFSIYLLHMPFAGIVVYIGNTYLSVWQFELCRPFIALCIVEITIIVYRLIANKLPEKPSKIMKMCIGLR